jgi:uncharacterized protein
MSTPSYEPGAPSSTGLPPGPRPLSPSAERGWSVAAHLSAVPVAWLTVGVLAFLGPLGVLLVAGDRSPMVRAHAVEALNFTLSWLLYAVVGAVLALVLVGFVVLAALAVSYVVLVIMAAVAANEMRPYRYPLTIRFVR